MDKIINLINYKYNIFIQDVNLKIIITYLINYNIRILYKYIKIDYKKVTKNVKYIHIKFTKSCVLVFYPK